MTVTILRIIGILLGKGPACDDISIIAASQDRLRALRQRFSRSEAASRATFIRWFRTIGSASTSEELPSIA